MKSDIGVSVMTRLMSDKSHSGYSVSVANCASGHRVFLSYCGDTVLVTSFRSNDVVASDAMASHVASWLLSLPECELSQIYKEKKREGLSVH